MIENATETGLENLVEGHRRFRRIDYPEQKQLFEALAQGQTPQTMVISCCDSRVDPGRIFSAGPGELFVVRNVANLVPPYEESDRCPGTCAALEFAVTGLKVRSILVMGHASCGGVKACLACAEDPTASSRFIGPWVSILAPARDEVLHRHAEASAEELQREMELAGIQQSLENLKTFPFVAEAVAAGELRLQGAFFNIATGELLLLDDACGAFETID